MSTMFMLVVMVMLLAHQFAAAVFGGGEMRSTETHLLYR